MLTPSGSTNICFENNMIENSPTQASPQKKPKRIEWILTEEAADKGVVKLEFPK